MKKQQSAKGHGRIQNCCNILSIGSSFQPIITRHVKKQESVTHTREESQSVETDSDSLKWVQMLDFAGKDFKAAVIDMIKEIQENMIRELKEE